MYKADALQFRGICLLRTRISCLSCVDPLALLPSLALKIQSKTLRKLIRPCVIWLLPTLFYPYPTTYLPSDSLNSSHTETLRSRNSRSCGFSPSSHFRRKAFIFPAARGVAC